jgi:subtilase family serine protease
MVETPGLVDVLGGIVRKGRTIALAAGAAALATGLVAAFAPAVPASTQPSPTADAPMIVIKPGALHLTSALASAPTTSQCEKAFQVACYVPSQVRAAYNLPPLYSRGITGKGQTIVIVDSFGSPTIKNDLATYDKAFGLPAPPSFKVLTPVAAIPPWNPGNSDMVGWAGETTLDVEWAHTIAPQANIALVETPVSETEGVTGFPQIVAAETDVIKDPAQYGIGKPGVISQSFSATEETFGGIRQVTPLRAAYTLAAEPRYNVTVLAASGDSGAADLGLDQTTYYTKAVTSWPDSDPDVTGVGGTELKQNSAGGWYSVAWNDTYSKATQEYIYGNPGPNPLASGGGKSVLFGRPSYQNGVQAVTGSARGVPDISMSGACSGLVDTYESYPPGSPGLANGWYPTCGTSEATPLFAGVVALADQVAGHSLGLINPKLYQLSASHAPGLVDVTSGNNQVTFTQGGKTYTIAGFPARKGYDLVTGVGTVNARYLAFELAGKPLP